MCDRFMYLLNNEDLCPDEVFRDFIQEKKKKKRTDRQQAKKKNILANVKN